MARKKSLEDENEEILWFEIVDEKGTEAVGSRWERWLLQDEHSLKKSRGKAVQTINNLENEEPFIIRNLRPWNRDFQKYESSSRLD